MSLQNVKEKAVKWWVSQPLQNKTETNGNIFDFWGIWSQLKVLDKLEVDNAMIRAV